ncbi:MAG: hypothetical protein IBX58_17120 [Roseovarius sp.]|nr:hypothetical protein [Roseovarius sp.]
MFGRIRNQWKEARADVVRKSVEDILSRYNGYGWYERYELISAFDYTKRDLEIEHGAISEWPQETQSALGKQLLEAAKKGFRTAPYGASGMALLSMYLDSHTIPGENAARLRMEIEAWHRRAAQTDLKSPSVE